MQRPILVVDDAPVMLLAYTTVLQSIGARVDTARTLDEATALIEQNVYSLVITDLRLTAYGGEEGFEIIRLAKSGNPDTRVMLVTGQGGPAVFSRAHELGVDLCLAKPLEPRPFKASVVSLVHSYAAQPVLLGRDEASVLRSEEP